MAGLDSLLRIDAMRHGETECRQERVSIDEADDLTSKGKAQVTRSAGRLADVILRELDEHPDLSVEISSSPRGRALYSAKIIRDVFGGRGIPLKSCACFQGDVGIIDALEMIEGGWDWPLYAPLALGGEVSLDDETFYVDSKKTNPHGFDDFEFFIREALERVPSQVRSELPRKYLKIVDGFEKAVDCTERFMRFVSGYTKVRDSRHVVLAAHSELLYYPANVFSEGKINLVDRGSYVSFERRNGKLVVTGVGDLTEGRSDIDIVEAFNVDAPLLREGRKTVYFK